VREEDPIETTTTAAEPERKLYRRSGSKLVAGVAGGLADHLGVSALAVRLTFVLLTGLSGAGALLYAVFWVAVPQERYVPPARPGRRRTGRLRRQRGQLVAFGLITAGIVLLFDRVGIIARNALFWPAAIMAIGAAMIWRQADDSERSRWGGSLRSLVASTRRMVVVRLIGGGALVLLGMAVFLALSGTWTTVRNGLFASAVIVAGLALVTGPFWWKLIHQLTEERRARIRSEERADFAAMVHDSVLHTLALIQRHSADPREVARLARGQERELRNWLYKGQSSPDTRFAAALEAAAAEVEDTYALSVENVVVGDCPVDGRLAAVVQAAREALVNAGRHAGVPEVSLYAEVEDDQVSVFVRDRGKGFDPDVVPTDRHGLSGSIVGRMERHGGRTEVRSTPGTGTEVRLYMPRK
jgi:signal transduction histidine kinase/phage shock protein PspC (stress-responsive transcriptional regulator)